MTTKVQLLALIATTLAICSCKNLSTATHSTTDTLRTTTLHYDSVIIDRQTNTLHLHDTVIHLISENRTHFKIHHDTIYLSKTDTTLLHTKHTSTTSDDSNTFPFHLLMIIAILATLLWSIKSRN